MMFLEHRNDSEWGKEGHFHLNKEKQNQRQTMGRNFNWLFNASKLQYVFSGATCP